MYICINFLKRYFYLLTRDQQVHHYPYLYLFNQPHYLYPCWYSYSAGFNTTVGILSLKLMWVYQKLPYLSFIVKLFAKQQQNLVSDHFKSRENCCFWQIKFGLLSCYNYCLLENYRINSIASDQWSI